MRKRTKVKGLPQVKRRLLAVPKETAKEVDAVLAAGADKHVAMSKARVRVKSGEAQRSIHREKGAPPDSGIPPTAIAYSVYAGGGSAFHVVFLEHGTSKMPAYLFFYPPGRLVAREVNAKLEKAADRGADRAIKRA